jgi:AcrR family transcriptional regulator
VPRISGPDIATHVARQEAAVVRAAVDLFAQRGFADVTMADIATRVGLARTSLYRYFPDKDHILLAWLRTEVDTLVERSHAIAAADAPATERLTRWLRLQLDYVREPDHQLFTGIAASMGTLDAAVRAEVTDQHQRLYATVEHIVTDALAEFGSEGRDPHVVATLVLGLFRAAGDAMAHGSDPDAVTEELCRSATALVTA